MYVFVSDELNRHEILLKGTQTFTFVVSNLVTMKIGSQLTSYLERDYRNIILNYTQYRLSCRNIGSIFFGVSDNPGLPRVSG